MDNSFKQDTYYFLYTEQQEVLAEAVELAYLI